MTMHSAITSISSTAGTSAAWALHRPQVQYFIPTRYTLERPESHSDKGARR